MAEYWPRYAKSSHLDFTLSQQDISTIILMKQEHPTTCLLYTSDAALVWFKIELLRANEPILFSRVFSPQSRMKKFSFWPYNKSLHDQACSSKWLNIGLVMQNPATLTSRLVNRTYLL